MLFRVWLGHMECVGVLLACVCVCVWTSVDKCGGKAQENPIPAIGVANDFVGVEVELHGQLWLQTLLVAILRVSPCIFLESQSCFCLWHVVQSWQPSLAKVPRSSPRVETPWHAVLRPEEKAFT